MFKVRNGNSAFKQVFGTYEQARQFARKQLRVMARKGKIKRNISTVLWDSVSRNPSSITAYNFSIVRV